MAELNTSIERIEREREREFDRILTLITVGIIAYQDEVIRQGITNAGEIKIAVERIIDTSGYNEFVSELLNAEYQDIVNNTYEYYTDRIKKGFDINANVINELSNKQIIESDIYNNLSDGLAIKITETLINAGFQSIDGRLASEAVLNDINTFSNYNKTEITGTLFQAAAIATVGIGQSAGFDKFQYVGPLDDKTRPFCREHLNEVRTMEGWDELDNGQLNPVSVYLGGYNCRHHYEAV